jgi:NAD(P)-dependent dehydrogenase (short-subunit alcohol dehydrogenase family)
MSSVNGRVALITGGARGVGAEVARRLITGGARGVGAEVARRLHEKGAKLVLTDLDEAPLKELAAELGEDRVLTAIADVRDLGAMQAAVDRGIERFGGVDVLMANAGIATYGSVMPRMDAEVAALGRSMSARTEAIEKQ